MIAVTQCFSSIFLSLSMILQVRVLARETIVTETIAPKGEQYLVTGVSLLFRKKATNPKKPFRGRNIQRILRTGDRSGAKLFHRGKIGDEEVWRGGSTSLVESYPRRKLIPSGRKYRLRFRFLVPLFSRASRKTAVQKTMDVVPKFL